MQKLNKKPPGSNVLLIRANVSQLPQLLKNQGSKPFKMIYAGSVLDSKVLKETEPEVMQAIQQLLKPKGILAGHIGVSVEKYGLKVLRSSGSFQLATPDAAMAAAHGGVDLKAKDLKMDVTKLGTVPSFSSFSQTLFLTDDFTGLVPVIIKITPIHGAWPMLGIKPAV